jgi:hypothetical protein
VAIAARSGAIAIADHVTTSVDFLTAEGVPVARWLGSAEEPGTLSLPDALDWTPEGDLDVLDPVFRKVIRLNGQGRFVGESPLGPALDAVPDWWVWLRGTDVVGVPTPRLIGTDEWRGLVMPLLRFRNRGSAKDTLLTATVTLEHGSGFSPSVRPGMHVPAAAPLPGGYLVVAGDIPQFRIRTLSPDGKVVRVICHVTAGFPPSDHQDRLAPRGGRTPRRSLLARVGRLLSDGTGRIWVQRDWVSGALVQDRSFGPLGATFDILGTDGRILGRVRAPADTRIAAAQGDVVIGLRTDNVGMASVVAFQLVR